MNTGLLMYLAAQDGNEGREDQREMRQHPARDYDRDTTVRYRGEYEGDTISRYRGDDGQWKPGRRRSAYGGDWPVQSMEREPMHRQSEPMSRYMPVRSEDDDEPERKHYGVTVVPKDRMRGDYGREDHWNPNQWPYAPGMEDEGDYRRNRQIGFGAARMGHDGGSAREGMMMGGANGYQDDDGMEFTREMAEEWVRGLKNEDKTRPTGGRWTMEELKPMAQKFGIKADPYNPEFLEFYAVTNAMYSDYCEVAKKNNITSPEFYGMMALAFINDKDAMPGKAARYYRYIVKKAG